MTSRSILLLLAFCPACAGPAAGAAPAGEPPPPVASVPPPAADGHDRSAAPAFGEPAAEPAEAEAEAEAEAPQASWFEPLPALQLASLSDAQRKQAAACAEGRGLDDPDVPPATLMDVASCYRNAGFPGPEIRLYRHLLDRCPDAPQAKEAVQRCGARYEQIDARQPAVDAYVAFLKRYPKDAEARALGQRAACLAHSLGDVGKVEEILAQLERLYGRRGFVRPDAASLAARCAAVPPLPPREPIR